MCSPNLFSLALVHWELCVSCDLFKKGSRQPLRVVYPRVYHPSIARTYCSICFCWQVSRKSVLTQTRSIWEIRARNYPRVARNFDVFPMGPVPVSKKPKYDKTQLLFVRVSEQCSEYVCCIFERNAFLLHFPIMCMLYVCCVLAICWTFCVNN